MQSRIMDVYPSQPNSHASHTVRPKLSRRHVKGIGELSVKHTAPATKRPSRWNFLSYPVLLLSGAALGVLALNAKFGQLLLIVYGVISLIIKLRSSFSFIMSLLALTLTPLFLLLQKNGLAENFAIYSIILLVFGVISTLLEEHRQSKITK